MVGAVKPPWIHEEDFNKLPFNYCDRWCERCETRRNCRVYVMELERNAKYLARGKDPKSMESALETIEENFAMIGKMLEKDMKKWGIDPNNLPVEEEEEFNAEESDLYKMAFGISLKLKRILSDLQVIPEEADEDFIVESYEVINYYQLFLPPKIFRAVLSREEEKEMENDCTFDAKNSAFLAGNALVAISQSLAELASYRPLKLSITHTSDVW